MEEYEKRASQRKESKPKEPWQIFVSQGCKMRSVIPYCLKMLTNNNRIVLNGMGAQINKTISVAEIVKRKHRDVSQETELSYTEFEDRWEPKDESKGLDSLCVTRNVPTITIVLSLNGEERPAVMDSISEEALGQLKKELKANLKEIVTSKSD